MNLAGSGKDEKMEFTPRRLFPKLSVDTLYTAFSVEYDIGFHFPGESHEMWELDCVMHGTAGFTSGTMLYECREGELVIHPGGIFHTAWALNDERLRIMTLSFSGEGVEVLVPAGKFSLTPFEMKTAVLLQEQVMACYGQKALSEYSVSDDNDQITKGLLETLLISLHKRRVETSVPLTRGDSGRFMEIAEYMKDHILDNLYTENICTECGIGRSALKELFRRYTGGGVMKYYNYLRVRQAVRFMERGLSMADIAAVMNFSSQNYFTVFFKRETGMTPSAYCAEKLERQRQIRL